MSVTKIAVEHKFPVGTVVRYVHGERDATIIGVRLGLGGVVYELRYIDNGQTTIRLTDEVDRIFIDRSRCSDNTPGEGYRPDNPHDAGSRCSDSPAGQDGAA